MLTRRSLFSVLAAVTLLTILSQAALALPVVRDESGQVIRPICPTEEVWERKKADLPDIHEGLHKALPPCAEGNCDDPAVRDASDRSTTTINTIVHVINDGSGNSPDGVNQAVVDAQMAEMNQDYAAYGIQFSYTTEYHNDSNYHCISSYHPYSSGWYGDIQNAKATYFHDTDTHLNILVTCQDSSRWGTLLGIGTFPWDPDALTNQGGLWVNSRFFGSGNKTITHEAGHNLGLWHTHHGVDETSGCSDSCSENVHALDDPAADLVGDYCKDTQATPTNYECSHPSGTDCNGVSWDANGDSVYLNYMGYGPDSCISEFTFDQEGRMHCWGRDALAGWFGSSSCTDTAPTAPSSLASTSASDSQIDLTWTDNSANEDGFRIERDGGSGFVEIATVGADVTSYSDTGLDCETAYSYQVRAYNCGGESAYTNTSSATTGTCPAGPTMHISSIDLSTRSRGPWLSAEGYVTVVDGGGSPVANATVSADWSGTTSSSQSAITGSDGRAFFESDRVRNASSYCWTLTVTNVTLSGATYDAAANAETSDSVGNACGSARIASADVGMTVHPNPFNPSTRIAFDLPKAGKVTLRIYDAAGRQIATLLNEHRRAGLGEVTWRGVDDSGRPAASGIYYARLTSGDLVRTSRLVLLK